MSASLIPELEGLSDEALEAFRKVNHSREYFEKTFASAISGFSVRRYWRGQLGQKDAGVIEYHHDLMVNDTRINVQAFMVSTFANGRRYTLTCNAPFGNAESAKRAFDQIRMTTLFIR
jgi:hypothetical protein